jgi:hypothetical protein
LRSCVDLRRGFGFVGHEERALDVWLGHYR